MARQRNGNTTPGAGDNSAPLTAATDEATGGAGTEAQTSDETGSGEKIHLHVLKPFKFISAQYGERHVDKGDQYFDPDEPEDAHFLGHPYIHKHLADGAIEHPKATRERLQAQADAAVAKAESNKQLLVEAEESFRRFQRNADINKVTSKDLDAELNTPIDQLPQR